MASIPTLVCAAFIWTATGAPEPARSRYKRCTPLGTGGPRADPQSASLARYKDWSVGWGRRTGFASHCRRLLGRAHSSRSSLSSRSLRYRLGLRRCDSGGCAPRLRVCERRAVGLALMRRAPPLMNVAESNHALTTSSRNGFLILLTETLVNHVNHCFLTPSKQRCSNSPRTAFIYRY